MKRGIRTELIDIHDVTRIFNLSIEAIRKYKALGLIESCHRVGRKDLYNEHEILSAKRLINSYKQEGKLLKDIVVEIKQCREQMLFEREQSKTSNSKKILIIEDKVEFIGILRECLRTRFSKDEVEIYEAKDGIIGISLAESIKPDIVILDVVLPIISGIDIYEILTKKTVPCQPKFLIMSGKVKYEPKNGTGTYIAKPFGIDEFLDKVQTLLVVNQDTDRGLHCSRESSG